MKNRMISVLAILAACAFGGGALAQVSSGGPPGGEHGPWGPGAMRPGMADMHQRMEERKAAHMKALHDALNIRPDQEAAFGAFASAMASGHDMDGHHADRMDGDRMHGDHEDMDNLTTPERLDRMAQRIDEHIARMRAAFQRRADAAKALYAALNPDQRRTMDALETLKATDEERDEKMGPAGMGAE